MARTKLSWRAAPRCSRRCGAERMTPRPMAFSISRPLAFAAHACCAIVLLAPMLAGCSKKTTAPKSNPTLSGRVRLVGTLTADDGTVTGARVVDDADGVRVYLVRGGQ